MYRTISSVRRRMSPELFSQGASALRCPHCHAHFRRRQEHKLMTAYWGVCKVCGKEVDTDTTELSILPDYHKFLNKKELFNRVWYHATDREDWEQGLKDFLTAPYYIPGTGHVDRPITEQRRIFVHLGSKESAARRSKDLGGLPYTYKVMMFPDKDVSSKVFADHNWWPHWLGERSGAFSQFTEINRYVNRYEVPGSVSLLAAQGSFRVVERVKNKI